jgi:MFS family permease
MSQRTVSLQAYVIWAIGALFYGYEVCLQISPSVMLSNLMQTFQINGVLVSNLAAFYFYAYTPMQIPSGLLLDKFGPRKMMLCAFLLCAFGAFLFGSATYLIQAQCGRLIIGLGSSFAIVGTFKIISNWFPAKMFPFMSALTVTIGMCGAIGAGAPLAYAVETIGWRTSMFLFTGAGLLLFAVAWFILFDQKDKNDSSYQTQPSLVQKSLLKALIEVLTSKQNWIVAVYGGLMFAPTSAFAGLWGVSFISSAYGVSTKLAGSAISMTFIGWIIGGPFFGKVSDYLNRRKATLLFSALGSCISFYLVVYCIISIHLAFLWLFLFGFCSSAFLPCFSIIQEINSSTTNATALGYMNTMNMVGGAALQPLLGHLLDLHWQGKFINGVRFYDVADFQNALNIIFVLFIIAAILFFFIKEPEHS